MGDFIEEEEEDLYSDLPNFKYDETVDKLQAGNKELQSRVVFLEEELEKQTKELDGIRAQCETLTKNISSLLKTAQNEIKRKDNKISELNKTVLELRTEILTLRKRKYDGIKPTRDEEPVPKQQKLDNSPSVKSSISHFFCNSETIEKSPNVEETDGPEIEMPQKQNAPDIKIHTVYSKRMYNKIYNIGNVNSNMKNVSVEIKNNDVFLENNTEVNINAKLEDKNISLSKSKIAKEKVGDERKNLTNSNLKEKEAIVDSLQNNNPCIKNSKPIFNVFKNESLITDNKKVSLPPTNNAISETKCIEPNKEVSTHDNGTSSPRTEKFSSDNSYDVTIKTDNCSQGNKRAFISRMNRSINFPRTENHSGHVQIKNCSQDSIISSVVNKDEVSNVGDVKMSEEVDNSLNKTPDHCNEKLISNTKENVNSQFSKSYCLKKSKKSIKSVICPISGEWAKNTEAALPGNTIEIDVSKTVSPNIKTGKEDLDIMEALFGSPLKWTENSIDDSKQMEKLSPPATAFEDSCSAHIENLKFKETRNNVTEISETKITELSLTKKFSYTETKCYFQPSVTEVDNELPKFDIEKKSDISLSKEILKQSNITHWPFKKTNNEIPSKTRVVTSPTFSTFVNTESTSEACDVPPSLKSNPNTLDVNPSTKILRSPKYNDSVLGQFDDTTQLINALAKDPSKLSPIHTPKKETKSDDNSPKAQSQSVENCADKPLTISTDKNVLAVSDIEEKKLTQKEPNTSVDKNKSEPVSKVSLSSKKSPKSNNVDKKTSDTKSLISTGEKKLSIPASVISSVERKLSFPFSVLSPVDKKIEKKTILLEQPINILCPRKTPRQIGTSKQNTVSKKQNMEKEIKKKNENELNLIKSPSPLNEKQSKTSRSTPEIAAAGRVKNLKDEGSDLKKHHIVKKSEDYRHSKSPSNKFAKDKRTSSKTVISSPISEDRKIVSVKASFEKDRSSSKERIKHSSARKENFPHRREHKSPSKKENSPFKFRRDHRQVRRDSKHEGGFPIFKRPLARRESFKRPNCFFRQSSVERKIAKDLRHSSKIRSFPAKTGNLCESTSTNNYKVTKSSLDNKIMDSKESQSLGHTPKAPLISRSSRISWSSSTSLIVSTKPSVIQSKSESTITPPSEMKWILRPIDFGKSLSNTLKESSTRSIAESSLNASVSSSKTEGETPISKFMQTADSSITTTERSSPGKSIVIKAERRPIKFGSNN